MCGDAAGVGLICSLTAPLGPEAADGVFLSKSTCWQALGGHTQPPREHLIPAMSVKMLEIKYFAV